MNKLKVAITDRFHPQAMSLLERHPQIELVPLGPQVDALIIRSKTKIEKELCERLPNLKLVISTTSGFDHMSLKVAAEKGIVLMHTPEAHAQSVAELTFALLIGCARNLQNLRVDMDKGEWRNPQRAPGTLLQGKRLGIVGLGRIGSRVARMAKAFEMQVAACDPYQEDHVWEQLQIERLSYDEILRSQDILSYHVPLTPRTRYMFNKDCLEVIQDGLILINTCRGEVIQEVALLEGLSSRQIGGAGLDVFEYEPLKVNSPLLSMNHVFVTPHTGALTETAFLQASLEGANKLIQYVETGKTSDTLPPQTEWFRDSC